jgi:hypothetical protein
MLYLRIPRQLIARPLAVQPGSVCIETGKRAKIKRQPPADLTKVSSSAGDDFVNAFTQKPDSPIPLRTGQQSAAAVDCLQCDHSPFALLAELRLDTANRDSTEPKSSGWVDPGERANCGTGQRLPDPVRCSPPAVHEDPDSQRRSPDNVASAREAQSQVCGYQAHDAQRLDKLPSDRFACSV